MGCCDQHVRSEEAVKPTLAFRIYGEGASASAGALFHSGQWRPCHIKITHPLIRCPCWESPNFETLAQRSRCAPLPKGAGASFLLVLFTRNPAALV